MVAIGPKTLWEMSNRQSLALKAIRQPEIKGVCYGGAKGGGKAQALNTPILTTAGWKILGEIKVGSEIFDETGAPCNVVNLSPIKKKPDCYRLVFSDGSEIVADAEHQWVTETHLERGNDARRGDQFRAERRAKRRPRGTGKRPDLAMRNATQKYKYKPSTSGTVRTTEEIAQTLRYHEFINHSVRVADPLQYPTGELPVPPYVLGCWLGDGSRRGGAFANPDIQIIEEIRKEGFEVNKSKGEAYCWYIKGLIGPLRSAGVLGRKHVPEIYKRASIDQRLALLAGIVDTDGHVDERGSIEICLSDEVLARDVHELIIGLGIKSTIRQLEAWLKGKRCKDRYRMKFATALPVCRLYRKRIRQDTNPSLRTRRRYIVACDRVKPVPMRCIGVDSPSRLFLAGRSLIPTHNSVFGCMWSYLQAGWLIEKYGLKQREHPIPVGFMGRRRGVDFRDTTLETWKKFIPPGGYRLRPGDKEIIIGEAVKICYGGMDNELVVAKFNSAEFCFVFVDQAEELTADQIGLLRGTLRLKINDEDVPTKELYTANPASCWLKGEFVDKARPGYRFIRALPADNPFLHGEYVPMLERAFEHRPELLAAYRDGSWDMLAGHDVVVKDLWIQEALDRTIHDRCGAIYLICEPSRYGDDETVIYLMQDGDILGDLIFGKHDLMYTANRLHVLALEHDAEHIGVEITGLGGGIADRLVEMAGDSYQVHQIDPAAGATGANRHGGGVKRPVIYLNRRAEMWDTAGRELEEGTIDLNYDDDELRRQLGQVKYEFKAGKMKIEDKDKIKQRLGRSPDRADAWVEGIWLGKQLGDRASGDSRSRRRRERQRAYRRHTAAGAMAM